MTTTSPSWLEVDLILIKSAQLCISLISTVTFCSFQTSTTAASSNVITDLLNTAFTAAVVSKWNPSMKMNFNQKIYFNLCNTQPDLFENNYQNNSQPHSLELWLHFSRLLLPSRDLTPPLPGFFLPILKYEFHLLSRRAEQALRAGRNQWGGYWG